MDGAEARRKDMIHNILLKAELGVRNTYPRGVPPGPFREQLQKQRESEAGQACMQREFLKAVIRKRLTQHVQCGSIAMAANCRRS
jgi:hypothetical protein